MGWSLYDLKRDAIWHIDMLWPRVQDKLYKHGLLEPLENAAERVSDRYHNQKAKLVAAFTTSVSDVLPEDTPQFILDKRLAERRFAIQNAEDAVVIEDDLPQLTYKP